MQRLEGEKQIAGGNQKGDNSTTTSCEIDARSLWPAGPRHGIGMFLGLLKDYGYGLRAASGVVLLLCLLVLVSFFSF